MIQHATTLRAATPTFDEGRVFARYLDTAAEGFFRFMLGRRSIEALAAVYVQPGHDLSFENVTFAESDEVIVGIVSGYTAEKHRSSSMQPLKRAAGSWNVRFRIVAVLFAPFLRIIDTIDDGDFYLQAIAVDSEVRGAGVGRALMDQAENQAVATGSARLVLDVSAENQSARKFYERRGMTVASQWPKRWVLPKFTMLRIVGAL